MIETTKTRFNNIPHTFRVRMKKYHKQQETVITQILTELKKHREIDFARAN